MNRLSRKSRRSSIPTYPPELSGHHRQEELILQQLFELEKLFRDYYELMQKEIHMQRELMNRMWVLSQRYIIVISTGACCKFPDVYSGPTEDIVLHEYNEKLKHIRDSNCLVSRSLNAIRPQCQKFEMLCSKLDMTVETPLTMGDTFHKPLTFFIELISDVFKYLHAMCLKLKYCSHQLDPAESIPLEEYKAMLEIPEDFEEYFNMGLTYCKCLRPAPQCENHSNAQ